jgi:hypothetical protein
MDRSLRAPLSPHEELALRRIAIGAAAPPSPEVERLKKLGLVEDDDVAVRLTEAGRERHAQLPDAPPAQDADPAAVQPSGPPVQRRGSS